MEKSRKAKGFCDVQNVSIVYSVFAMSLAEDASSFTVAVDQWLQKTNLRADEVIRRIALRLWQELTARTPVDTGRMRAKWVT